MAQITNDYFRASDPCLERTTLNGVTEWPPTWIGRLYEYQWALNELKRIPHATVLDVGCGQACHQFKELALQSASFVLGVDPCAAAHKEDKRLLLMKSDFFESNIWRWGRFDYVVCISVLEHINPEARLPFLRLNHHNILFFLF